MTENGIQFTSRSDSLRLAASLFAPNRPVQPESGRAAQIRGQISLLHSFGLDICISALLKEQTGLKLYSMIWPKMAIYFRLGWWKGMISDRCSFFTVGTVKRLDCSWPANLSLPDFPIQGLIRKIVRKCSLPAWWPLLGCRSSLRSRGDSTILPFWAQILVQASWNLLGLCQSGQPAVSLYTNPNLSFSRCPGLIFGHSLSMT